MKKAVKYLLYAAGGLLVLLCCFSSDFRQSLLAVFHVTEKNAIRMLEDSAEAGDLALEKYNTLYNKKARQLQILIAHRKDALHAEQEMERKAAEAREQGKIEQAVRLEQEKAWYREESGKYDARITKLTEQLKQFDKLRENARQDVALVRRRIAFVRSAGNALQDTGEDEELQRAEELVDRLHGRLNLLEAEAEVLNLAE
ncbi:MAG TPA: hypothetical protein H9862_02215 [Candidatus Akkermansia intestinigallinarum]|uniref:Uncharacterized protein n=1 Tax=Candidatus Akkermansia intestinigallinarum TaxID=2838431 RepID=A0A9D2AHG7_9BACT|nr:hypothetical protein [Candidatus Akkermansia intestinigallinarum]